MATITRRTAPTAATNGKRPRTRARAAKRSTIAKDDLIAAITSDLLTLSGVTQMTGIPESNMTIYHGRGGAPPPDIRIGRTPLWHYSTIEKWAANRGDGKTK